MLKILVVLLFDIGLKLFAWTLLDGEVIIPIHRGVKLLMLTLYFILILSLIISIKLMKKIPSSYAIWLILILIQHLIYQIYSFYSYRTDSADFIMLGWDYLLWELLNPFIMLGSQITFYISFLHFRKFKKGKNNLVLY